MTFALESCCAIRGGVVWIALALAACAEGTAGSKEPFEGTLDNGTSAEPDGAAKGGAGGDNDQDASAAGGASNGNTGGNGAATNGGTMSASGGSTGPSTVGDAGSMTMADAGSTKDAGTTCLPGTSQCGALCVDLKSSAANCGRCGHPCPGGQACNGAGVCLAPANCTLLTLGEHDYFACAGSKNWTDARTACLGWGMDLAMIETAPEAALLKANPGWIGYSDQTSEGSWRWVKPGGAVNGATASYTNWDLSSDEPNNDRHCNFFGSCSAPDGEDCGEILSDGTWNDADCDTSRAFLCETY